MSTLLKPPPLTPKLTDRPVHEPASDWASSTLDALGPVSQVDSSNPSTPGPHVPGAYPGPIHFKSGVVQQDTQHVKEATIGALQSAKELVPMSLEDVKHLLENAGDTVVGYLPERVAAYLPHHTADTSLLSEPNSQNAHSASSGGEGTPSGPIEHSSTNSSLSSEEISQNIPNEFGVTTLHDYNSGTLNSESGIATSPEERRHQQIPDTPFATGKDESLTTGGVGILHEDKEEIGLAPLPEEEHGSVSGANTDTSTRSLRGTSSAESDSLASKVRDRDISQDVLPVAGSTSFSPLPISTSNKSTTTSSTPASHPIAPNTTGMTHQLASGGGRFNGVSLSDSKLGEESSSPIEKSIDGRPNLEQGQNEATPQHETTPAATSSHVGQAVRKKAGFMDRLRGEVKVISGKLSHKESKVERTT